MTGSITRALSWDNVYEQQFIAVTPLGDEVLLYQTNHEDPGVESNSMSKLYSRAGFENIICSSYSDINKGIVGVGSINGNISIFDIYSPNSSVLSLRPKQNRPCNSISFSNNNLVAVGFDKGRQDNSLQIWSVESYSSAGNNSHLKRPVTTYLPNEAILSTVFYPDQNSNIICGSYKFLREIDLRADQPIYQMATKCTFGLQIDYFQSHLFQSFSEDGSLAIWDSRKLTANKYKQLGPTNVITETPVLQFNRLLSDASSRKVTNPCVRYSTVRRGEFAAVFNGDLIRRWQTDIVPSDDNVVEPFRTKESSTLQSLKQQAAQLYKPKEESLFVSLVLDTKTDYEKVVSFDYSPDITSHTSTNFVCMRQSGTVFRMPVVECIEALDFNPINEFSIAGPEGTATNFLDKQFLEVSQPNDQLALPRQRHRSSLGRLGDLTLNDELNKHDDATVTSSTVDDESLAQSNLPHGDKRYSFDNMFDEDIPLNRFLDSSDIIGNDICVAIRKRAQMGYGVDCDKNVSILDTLDAGDNKLFLKNTWKWLTLAKKSLDKGTMISEGIDLGYQGVLGIWKGVEELSGQVRTSKGEPISEAWMSQAVKSIISLKGQKTAGISIPSDSEKKAQRKLCLVVCGWYFTDTEFEEKLQTLIKQGYYEKAAGWAVFHGDVPKAIEILARAKSERLRLIATAVAGYLAYKNSHVNSPWKDQCRKMALELDDPYLRAIFAFIADDDWWDVLDESALSLRERLGVALCFLSDKDLGVYLNRIADSVVARGELEGLTLTGITPRGIDLLQSYVDRTTDVQTASLMASFACPRYFTDPRITHWTDCYRSLLNSWGLFGVRAKFDVARTKLSKTFEGQTTIKAAPKQVYLQCNRCNKNISKVKSSTANNQAMLKQQFNKLNNYNTNVKLTDIINACPHCGAPLPRCSICLLSLGSELPLELDDKLDGGSSSNVAARIENRFKEWFSFCLTCNHGCHAYHAEEWFSKHYICPVPDCNCRCNSK
ncbi:SEH-associated protein 4 [Candida viswanathii]|uniref:SEH-associated protein 4 n=1 Tax=Candida viswanathii TaxID=5486 RepID=A0A367YHL1_9ASCO|nr:SEH-associated protein 4 [Candida viswanathii]